MAHRRVPEDSHLAIHISTAAAQPPLCATLTGAVHAASKTPELGWDAMAGGWKR